jgi:SagB-type dehydrogenase family enzyme
MSEPSLIEHLEHFDYDELFDELKRAELRSVAWRFNNSPKSDYEWPRYVVDGEYEEKIPLGIGHTDSGIEQLPLVEVLKRRRSYSLNQMGESWSFHDVEQLFSLGAGTTTEKRYVVNDKHSAEIQFRSYPSGGSMYSIQMYFYAKQIDGLTDGVYWFSPEENSLYRLSGAISDPELEAMFPMTLYKMDRNSTTLETSSLFLFFVADFMYSFKKYGRLAYRLAQLEAGHIAQNLQLVCTALQKKSLPICGLFPDKIETLLGISKKKYMHCLYGMIFG